ncbi:hypothetical protein HG530_005938 [Fusarium avenaceum]|nr:hypothetical protein HG530_005938 [Fusarium avenaceum]
MRVSDVLAVVVIECGRADVLVQLALDMPRAAVVGWFLRGEMNVGKLDDDLRTRSIVEEPSGFHVTGVELDKFFQVCLGVWTVWGMVLPEPFSIPLFAFRHVFILFTRRLVFIHGAVILTAIFVRFTYVWNSTHISDIVSEDSLNVKVLMPSEDEVPSRQ